MDNKDSGSADNITEFSNLIDPSMSSDSSLTTRSTITEPLDMVHSTTSEVDPPSKSLGHSLPSICTNIPSLVTDDTISQKVIVEKDLVAEGACTESATETFGDSHTVSIRLEADEDAVSRVSSMPGVMCRICHCASDEAEIMISPCDCRGSVKWVHQKCLQRWVKSRDAKKCELCGYSFNMTSNVKPFRKWKKLNMSSVETRKILCSVTFHIVAITCVIWSLYVLIDRTTEEIKNGELDWPFWTKLVVVAIGFTGGLVFMYVQCKTYVKLFRRWKQFNRVIYINNIQLPDDECPTVSTNLSSSVSDDSSENSTSGHTSTLE